MACGQCFSFSVSGMLSGKNSTVDLTLLQGIFSAFEIFLYPWPEGYLLDHVVDLLGIFLCPYDLVLGKKFTNHLLGFPDTGVLSLKPTVIFLHTADSYLPYYTAS